MLSSRQSLLKDALRYENVLNEAYEQYLKYLGILRESIESVTLIKLDEALDLPLF